MMEVRGVFRSWDTLVISSALKRSLFICSFTAVVRPPEMLFSASAWPFRSAGRWAVSIWWFRFPAAMISVPFRTRPKPADHQHRPNHHRPSPPPPPEGIPIAKRPEMVRGKNSRQIQQKAQQCFPSQGQLPDKHGKPPPQESSPPCTAGWSGPAPSLSRTVTVRAAWPPAAPRL